MFIACVDPSSSSSLSHSPLSIFNFNGNSPEKEGKIKMKNDYN